MYWCGLQDPVIGGVPAKDQMAALEHGVCDMYRLQTNWVYTLSIFN